MNKLIKIYGERNTNTNYMSQLIKLNLKVLEIPGTVPPYVKRLQNLLPGNELVKDIYFHLTYSQNLGWKHTYVKSDILNKYSIVKNNEVAFLTITKNPYSWLLSLYRNPYHQYYSHKPSFETFLSSPWKTVERDNTDKLLKNPVELWNIKNSAYIKLSEFNVLNITTESIFQDPKAIIDLISCKFSLEKLSKEFINYESSTKKEKHRNSNYYRNYYLSEKWRDKISRDARSIINNTLDKNIMSHFGYQVLS